MDTDPDHLSAAWSATHDRLPDGWQLDGLRCASTGLTPEQRSQDWLAVATGPDGAELTFAAADAFDALDGLVAEANTLAPGPTPSPDHVLTDEEYWAAAAERGRQRPTSEISMLVPSPLPKG